MKRLLIPLMGLLWGCANVVAPTGGDKDNTPPVLLEASPAMESVQMKERTIILKFDEYVQLKDAFNQVLISPPLEEFPDIKIKGKNIVIRLPDSLLDNTTYTIQFGESIADITEGNPYSQFVYAFSTGEVIDSLYINGTVTDIWTGKPAANSLVLLYRNTEDSAFTTQKPTYFAKTNERGNFRISYVREGRYNLYALQDQNFNYFYDLPNESIAFLDSSLLVSQPIEQADLNLFTEARQKPFVSDARAVEPGLVRIIFNQAPDSLRYQTEQDHGGIFIHSGSDTLYHWSQVADADSQRIRISAIEMDTFLVIPQKKLPDNFFDNKLETAVPEPSGGSRNRFTAQELHQPYQLLMQRPIAAIDSSRMILKADSLDEKIEWSVQTDTNDLRRLIISTQWKADSIYTLTLLPGALTDLYGIENDTITRSFRIRSPKEYGKLEVNVTDSINRPIILQWLDKSGEVLAEKIPEWNDHNYLWQLQDLLPGTYIIRAIIDENGDGKWTTGSLAEKRQPEPLLYYQAEVQIRPDWEYTLNFKLSL